MQNVITAVAQVLALESGARFESLAGTAMSPRDGALHSVAAALTSRFEAAGIDVLAYRLQEGLLTATVDEGGAPEPLCPAAFARVVRELSFRLVGEVWEGSLALAPSVRMAKPVDQKQSVA